MSVGAASTPGGNTCPCGLPQCLCSRCCIRPTHLLVWEKLRQDLTGRIHHLLGCTGIDELCRGRRGGREGGAAMQFSQDACKSKGPQWITGPQMGLLYVAYMGRNPPSNIFSRRWSICAEDSRPPPPIEAAAAPAPPAPSPPMKSSGSASISWMPPCLSRLATAAWA